MYYVIQENMFSEPNYDILIQTLERMGLEYEIVKVRPFIEDFEFKTKRKDVFCFGSVKMTRLAKKYEWYPGSLLNENHDYRVYSQHYKENLLNYDSVIQKFGEPISESISNINGIFFARPCEDTKTFTGKSFFIEDWEEFKNGMLDGNETTSLTYDTPIQVCSHKLITKEFRFWIVDGKVVTGSQYRAGNLIYSTNLVDEGAKWFCLGMVSEMAENSYRLADAFVMDVCEVLIYGKPEYKIVECGCINCAGFYSADMQKLINALEIKYIKPDFSDYTKCYPRETK